MSKSISKWYDTYKNQIKAVPCLKSNEHNITEHNVVSEISKLSEYYAKKDIPAFKFIPQTTTNTEFKISKKVEIEKLSYQFNYQTQIPNIAVMDINKTYENNIPETNSITPYIDVSNKTNTKTEICLVLDAFYAEIQSKQNSNRTYEIIKDTKSKLNYHSLTQSVITQNGISKYCSDANERMPGFDCPWIFIGKEKTGSLIHSEPLGLHTFAYLRKGAPKAWYVVSVKATKQFMKDSAALPFKCKTPYAHKCLHIHPVYFLERGYNIYLIKQMAGEATVLNSFGMHGVANYGCNILETINCLGENYTQREFMDMVFMQNKKNDCTYCQENSLDCQLANNNQLQTQLKQILNERISKDNRIDTCHQKEANMYYWIYKVTSGYFQKFKVVKFTDKKILGIQVMSKSKIVHTVPVSIVCKNVSSDIVSKLNKNWIAKNESKLLKPSFTTIVNTHKYNGIPTVRSNSTPMIVKKSTSGKKWCEYHRMYHDRAHFKRDCNRKKGLKNFRCGECDKSFGTNGELKRHKLIHSGEKPFKCCHCWKAFGRKCNMKRHQKKCNK
eukprot:107195_1